MGGDVIFLKLKIFFYVNVTHILKFFESQLIIKGKNIKS